MNLRNLFRRGDINEQNNAARDMQNQPASLVNIDREMSMRDDTSSSEEADGRNNVVRENACDTHAVETTTVPVNHIEPWIVRDTETFVDEKRLMSRFWPQFHLEVIESAEGHYNGATCWSGKLKPGIYEDTEWEILAIYLSAGNGDGDWNGAIAIYFLDPSAEQIVETLGYQPTCMQVDADGTPILGNIRPIRLQNTSAAEAIWHAFRFCHTIEQMCVGMLPEGTLQSNDYLKNWENENFPQPITE